MNSDESAPRAGARFVNYRAVVQRTSFRAALSFLARRLWASLVARRGAAPRVSYDATAITRDPSITWIGHSTFLVRMDGVSFLTDPMFAARASPFSFAGPRRAVPPGVPLDAIVDVDFALLSHDHYDHADITAVTRLAKRGVPFVVPLGMKDWVESVGGAAVECDWWESVEVAGIRVHCVPAQHFSGRSFRDGGRRLWAGWVVAGPTRRFYHAGDSGYAPEFVTIGERLGPMDLAAVPIGAYRPAEMMHPVHVTPEEALRVARDVRARRVVAMHFGTFDLADEPLDEPPRRFRTEAERLGLDASQVWILKVGETRQW